jgi:hypothetical protein
VQHRYEQSSYIRLSFTFRTHRLGNTNRVVDLGSGRDLVLVGESAEEWFPADPIGRQVDRRRPGFGLGWRELPECAVPSGLVSVRQIGGQGPA